MPFKATRKAPASTGLTIRYRAIDSLRPYARNSRTHGKQQIAKLEASLARFGWTNPVLVAADEIVAGHARITAAGNIHARGGTIARHADTRLVPTIDLSDFTPAERRAYVIADNRLAIDAGWDNDMLRLELGDLRLEGFDLSLTGFSGVELRTFAGLAEDAGGRKLTDGMRFQVVIDCSGEAEQAAVLEEMKARGLKASPLIL